MRRIKLFVFIFLTVILIGCGAQVKYQTKVNTSQQSINIDIEITVVEDDYQYIKGGREKFVSVIKENIPKDLIFSIDKDNKNLYKFDLSFSSYQDYQTKYKAITNQDSKSVFQVSEFTDESPFKASQSIKMNDDMNYLLDWLKNALIDSGVISSEYKDKLINSQNSSYYFNDHISSNQSYQGDSIIDIIENNIYVSVKKNNKIDFQLTFLVSEDMNIEFEQHFEEYIKNKKTDVQLEKSLTTYNEIQCMQYDLKFIDLDTSSEDTVLKLNDVLGSDFLIVNSQDDKESSLFYNTYHQNLTLVFNMNKLFELNKVSSGNINLDIDGVKMNSEAEIPMNESISVDRSRYDFGIATTYTNIEYLMILITCGAIVLVFVCIKKFSKGKMKNFKISDVRKYYFQFETMLFHTLFENEINIEENQIVGKDFMILVTNIDKVDYGKSTEMISYLKRFLLPIGLGVVCYFIHMIWMSYLIFISTIFLIAMIIKMVYQYDSIELELASGKKYSFVLENPDNMKKLYLELLNKIECNDDLDEEFIKKVITEKGRESHEKD